MLKTKKGEGEQESLPYASFKWDYSLYLKLFGQKKTALLKKCRTAFKSCRLIASWFTPAFGYGRDVAFGQMQPAVVISANAAGVFFVGSSHSCVCHFVSPLPIIILRIGLSVLILIAPAGI